jgi:hypothetical protein
VSYYEQQLRHMTRMNAMRMMLATQGREPGPMQIARSVASRGKSTWSYNLSQGTPSTPKTGKTGMAALLGKAPWFANPGLKLASEALDTSPGRAILDVLSRTNYASANAQLETEKMRAEGKDVDSFLGLGNMELMERQAKAAWRGLSGKDKTTYADVDEFTDPEGGRVSRAAEGLAKDIALDPLTYLPMAGIISAIGKVTSKAPKVAKPVEVLAENIEKGEPISEAQTPIIQKILERSGESPPLRDTVEVAPKIDPAELTATAEANRILDKYREAPVYKYGNVDIEPPFKTIDEPIDSPVAKSDPQQDKLARLRAIKATILQEDDYEIGRWKVRDLRNAAQNQPDKAKAIEKLVNDEAKRVYKTQPEDFPTRATLYGRSGEKAPFALTLDKFTDLLRKGEVGSASKYDDDADKFLQQLPIHSVDDLDTVRIYNARGEQVSLKTYLEDLGVQLKSVDPKGKEISFGGIKLPTFDVPSKAVPATRTREVQDISPEWLTGASQYIDADDLKRLKSTKTKDEFNKTLREIALSTKAGEFKSLVDFVEAIRTRKVDTEWLEGFYKEVGVKDLDGLKAKISAITGKVKPKESKPGTVLREGTPEVSSKVQRIKGRIGADDFGSIVRSAEDLIDSGASISYTLPKLNPDQLQDLAKVLPGAVVKNLVDPADVAKYPFLTDLKKSKRTSATPGQGKARNIHGWNTYSQLDMFKGLVGAAAKRYPVAKGAGRDAWKRRSSSMYDDVMASLAAGEAALRREGVKLISGTDNAGIMLSLHDVLRSLPRELVERHLFNPGTSALPTDFIKAGDIAVRALTGQVQFDAARAAINITFKDSPKITKLKNSERVAGNLTQAILDNSDVILQRVEANYARHGIEVGKAVRSMSDGVIENVVNKYADPNVSIGEALGDFAMRGDEISSAGRKIDAPTEAYKEAKDATDITLATMLKPGDFAEAKATKDFAKVGTEQEAAKIGRQQQASRAQEAVDNIAPTVDLGDQYQAGLQGALFRAIVPLLDKAYSMQDALGRAFVANYGHKDLHEALRVERSVTQDFSRAHRALIAQLHDSIYAVAGTGARQHAQEAFRHLQNGTTPADPQMLQTMRGLQSSIDLTFGSSVNGLGSFAQRNGLFATHLNEIMDYYKVPKQFRFDGTKPITEQTQGWKNWEDVDDPLSLLDGVHASMQRASVEVTLGRDFSEKFGRTSAAPGYVRIKNSGNKSKIARFIDRDLFYPSHIAEQLGYLDQVLKGSLNRIKDPNAAEIVRMYDGIIHAWKSGLTIYRPGHHVRNLVGDVTLAFFDGVTNPAVYYKAVRIMSGRSKAYQGWDGQKALQEGIPLEGLKTGSNTRVRIGGKSKSFSDDMIWRAAFDQGIIPDFRTLEDIAFNAAQGMPAATNKVSWKQPTGGRARRVAGGLSQNRDHMVRIAHFVDVLQKGRFKTAEEAFATAGARVRKWHPDGSDLTNFENAVMRRSFMFYSWMRKAIPLVVETLVMKPGKAIMFPKAMYAMAEANGVDLESLGNPFPVDQLFPEFITDQVIGPQFGEAGAYRGINPGEPVTEMLSHWGSSDPQHGLGGALTPVVRVPMELYNNKNMGTGSEILDKTDYADSQIPFLGNVARATGMSPTSGFTQTTKDVERQNTDPGFNERELINFLSGIGLREYSKPNYIRRAQLEQRDKAREAYRNG